MGGVFLIHFYLFLNPLLICFWIVFDPYILKRRKTKFAFLIADRSADLNEFSDWAHWLDSDLIPRLLENFEKWENFMIILLSFKNNSYRRISDLGLNPATLNGVNSVHRHRVLLPPIVIKTVIWNRPEMDEAEEMTWSILFQFGFLFIP